MVLNGYNVGTSGEKWGKAMFFIGTYNHNLDEKNILRVPNIQKGKKTHPTEKPIELMKILIENSSLPQGVVLDPFMGTGSTGIACVNTGRNFIGIELDNNYFEIAKQRIEEAIK